MLEDSVLYVSPYTCSSRFHTSDVTSGTQFLADLQDLDLLPGKIETTDPSVSDLLHVRVAELASARGTCVLR